MALNYFIFLKIFFVNDFPSWILSLWSTVGDQSLWQKPPISGSQHIINLGVTSAILTYWFRNFFILWSTYLCWLCLKCSYTLVVLLFERFSQVKRCAEMSRKLRFFKDQISKAGVLASTRPILQEHIELEDLEVDFKHSSFLPLHSNAWLVGGYVRYP